ncbi:hypothetical protein BD324DRAFT_620003 [Kockovaella imperatae]|uniref:BZIP domain-containing protein n=1 Tax=Kockovaella imperatae TaxID=4999 RepID=A0A1Y1UJQ1_9TREE|nr:hypothetical protein BD324DRAFT_620003 [Kockovaella imperatae]ORX38212.1 hypothetical protein BD324DRAFT_620003 [Kockovaella imperatae]
MEPNWGGFYNYYPQDSSRAFDRPQQTSNANDATTSSHDEQSHRRHMNPGPFLPPPPPPGPLSHSSGSPHMNLPPFSHSFYSSYHPPSQSSPQSGGGGGPNLGGLSSSYGASSSSGFGGGNNGGGSSYHGGGGGGNGGGPSGHNNSAGMGTASPTTAPGLMGGGMSRGMPSNTRAPHSYSESPRLGHGGMNNYSSSPGLHHVSPTSPTTHLIPQSLFGGGGGGNTGPGGNTMNANSSGGFAGGPLRSGGMQGSIKRKDRKGGGGGGGSPSISGESWDESDKSGKPIIGEETEEQPWGMPQDQYKALNPRDKKQVRNRIGARRFRAKRKDYVSNLESSLRARDDEMNALKHQVDAYRTQINELRTRLGMPLLSPQISNSSSTPGLGLLVSQSGSDGWGDIKDD